MHLYQRAFIFMYLKRIRGKELQSENAKVVNRVILSIN